MLYTEFELLNGREKIVATGGGAFKYADYYQEKGGVEFVKMDEMSMLVMGISFVLEHVVNASFTNTFEEHRKYVRHAS